MARPSGRGFWRWRMSLLQTGSLHSVSLRADHESLSDWTKRVFQPGNNLLFIGAAGIAVRAIAPYVSAKQSRPGCGVMDEKANWCIPILSGHLGGANLLANKLAEKDRRAGGDYDGNGCTGRLGGGQLGETGKADGCKSFRN